jgi:beta-ribofuranosylaminobenzene 5'-phosphate synthase
MERFSTQSSGANQAPTQARQATVTTTARLHFGFLDPSGRGKHPFRSLGLSIDRPRTKLVLQRAPNFRVSGAERDRAERYLRSMAEGCGVRQAYALHVEEAIPPHAGLGSGTQLALAVGSAFAVLEGFELSPREIAARLQRGARSGIGIATFEGGGAVLDEGPRHGKLPELISRVPFPPAWRLLLILDAGYGGLAGASERAAFETLPDFPESESETLRRRITERALPAIAAGDFKRFCDEIDHLQSCMGSYYAPVQGGAYASPHVSAVLDWLRREGMTGLGQSSWGPTGFAFVASETDGKALLEEAEGLHRQPGLSFALARGNNEGAKIEADCTKFSKPRNRGTSSSR